MEKLPSLNLPKYNIKIKLIEGTVSIFDYVRKKYLKFSAEEWVRQNFIQYLNIEKKYPIGLMRVEQIIKYNLLKIRADIVLYNSNGEPNIIVECKAPEIKITQDVFYQIAKYNSQLKVNFLVVTNGLQHFCCRMNYDDKEILFLKEIPNYLG